MSSLRGDRPAPFNAKHFCYAFAVRDFVLFVAVVTLSGLMLSVGPASQRVLAQSTTPATQPPSQQPAPTQPAVPAQLPMAPQQAPPIFPPVIHAGATVILDPAHGGTDTGARGQAGAIEKDLVLQYARVVRGELERQGFRVVLTRDGDSNPSYDDRAAVANAYRDAVFISLHISSTGAPEMARVYYYHFGSSPAPSPTFVDPGATKNVSPATSLVRWEEAQLPHVQASHRLADALQVQLAQRFSGSPAIATAVAVRGLRSVEVPAVAIELSSVSAPDPASLASMGSPLAASISRGLQAFRGTGASGGN